MSEPPELDVAVQGGCWRITLQRPEKGNALSRHLVQGLAAALDEAYRARPRCVVLAGAGPHFCTGFDLSDLEHETDASLLERFVSVEQLLQSVYNAPCPTLALAQGRVMGAGADLFCACSQRWIVEDASFAFPGAAFGLVLGTARLADTVGARAAQDWVLSGARISAEAALRTGLAQRHVTAATVAHELAHTLEVMQRLDDITHAAVHEAIAATRCPRGVAGDADDLARLTRSAARPGLKSRILAYRSAHTQGRQADAKGVSRS